MPAAETVPIAVGASGQGPRLAYVDGLRGVAASWVVLFHADEGGHVPILKDWLPDWLHAMIFEWGDLGVAIFFALSGFVIAHSLRGRRVDAQLFGRFTLRRALRLDPPYFASIVLVVVVGALSASIKGESFELPAVGQLLAHLVYLQTFLGYDQINIVYWTLCMEIQFYLIYCAAEGVATRINASRRVADMVVFGPLAVVAIVWGAGLVSWGWRGLFVSHWHGFLLGALAQWAWIGRLRSGRFLLFCSMLGVAATVRGDAFTLACTVTAVFLCFASFRPVLGGWLGGSVLQFLGRISYSLYLIHNTVTGAAFWLIYRLFGKSGVVQVLAVPFVFLACAIAAWGLWWLVERPCLRIARGVRIARV